MTEPTQEARQRCADLANGHTCEMSLFSEVHFARHPYPERYAFAQHVQDTHDKASEIVRLINDYRNGDYVSLPKLEEIALSMMLPEPKDELHAAVTSAWAWRNIKPDPQMTEEIRNYFAKQGKRIVIEDIQP